MGLTVAHAAAAAAPGPSRSVSGCPGLHANRPCVQAWARARQSAGFGSPPRGWRRCSTCRAEGGGRAGILRTLPPPRFRRRRLPKPLRAARLFPCAEMRLLAQSYAITNWADYAAANNISGWVADNSVPVRCRPWPARFCVRRSQGICRLPCSAAADPTKQLHTHRCVLDAAGVPVDGRHLQP